MHWLITLNIFLLCGHCVLSLQCEYYSGSFSSAEKDPCKEGQRQYGVNGGCNFNETCDIGEEGYDIPLCYALWQNASGNITISKKGCWKQDDLTPCDSSQCIASSLHGDLLFCCCNEDFCNFDLHYDALLLKSTDEPDSEPVPVDDDQTLMSLVYAFVPIAVFSFAVIVGYFCYQKRKRPFDDLESASVDTPLTTSTINTNLLPPEMKLPQLIEMKARGRYGCVWKAQSQDRHVAVKVFYLQDKKSWQNEQEIFATELMHNHPNILHFIAAASRGVGVEQELWLITDFYELGSLADYLKIRTFNMSEALLFMKSMATGLAFLHHDIPSKGKPSIAHRDFKSKNVLIKDDLTACIADFGLAIIFTPGESPGESHGQVGTRRYMAPEILEGAINFNKDAFLRIDIYAMALVLWEIVTRCSDAPGGVHVTYRMPYEEELGQNATMEEMQEYVVEQKKRPTLEDAWRQHEVFGTICETMEDCWDNDSEARLSAANVEERLASFCRKSILMMYPETPMLDEKITNSLPSVIPTIDIELQNQINKRRSEQYCAAQDENATLEAHVEVSSAETALLDPEV